MSARTIAIPAVHTPKTPRASWVQLHRPSRISTHRQRQCILVPHAAWPLQQAAGRLSKFLMQQGTDTTESSAAQSAAAPPVDPQSLLQVATATSPPRLAKQHRSLSPPQQYVNSSVAPSWLDEMAAVEPDPSSARTTWPPDRARIPPGHDDVSDADVDRSDTQYHHSWRCVTDLPSSKDNSHCSSGSKVNEEISDQRCLDTMGSSSSSNSNSSSSSRGKVSSDSFMTHATSIKYAQHLSNVTSSHAATSARLESLTWLILQTQRWQQQLLLQLQEHTKHSSAPSYSSSSSSSWTDSSEGLQLLDLIYNLGQAVADLGVTAGTQLPLVDHVGRVILAVDYARILDRYCDVHGEVLGQKFWSQIDDIDLQARAIHISTTLDTRRTVHKLLLDHLTNNIGQDMLLLLPAAAGPSSSSSSSLAAPLASAVTNNNIIVNRTEVRGSQSTDVAATQAAAHSATSSSSSAAACKDTGSSSSSSFGLRSIFQGFVSLGGAVLIVWASAGKVVKLVLTIVVLAKDVLLHLLLLRAVAAAGKALAAAAATALPQMQLAGVLGLASRQQTAAGGLGGSSSSSRDVPRLQTQPVSAAAPKPAAAAAWSASGATLIGRGHDSDSNTSVDCHPAAVAAAAGLDVAEAVGGSWLIVPDQLQSAVTSKPALIVQTAPAQNVLELRSTRCNDSVRPRRLSATPGCFGMLAMHQVNPGQQD